MDTMFAWQCHMGRCGGDGRRLHAHEVVKRAMKELILSNPNLGGTAIPSSSVLTKPLHLRMDKTRPGDIMALRRDVHRMDMAMDIVIASGLTKLCLSSSRKSSDFVLKAAESKKFAKDKRTCNPISSSSTTRSIPLALNHLGLTCPQFQATLKEFATITVPKPEGCSLLSDPFAITHTGSLHKIIRVWRTRLTWTTKR
jgi:hypothetical protein